MFEAASLSVYGRFEAAALCVRGCSPVCSRLPPCVFEAAALCVRGCRRAVFIGIESRLETLNSGGAVLQDAA